MEKAELELRRDLLNDALKALIGTYSGRPYSSKYVRQISEALENTIHAIEEAEK